MANGASLIIGLIFIIVISVLAYFFSPKGENQTDCIHGAVAPACQARELDPETTVRAWFVIGAQLEHEEEQLDLFGGGIVGVRFKNRCGRANGNL
ncbi:MAG: hypothetical protein L6R41_005449 [Letrouitia leprolyta]|nr:MAG: hypothetical protein L6R41_005449 [Letrouitia leprolyta]